MKNIIIDNNDNAYWIGDNGESHEIIVQDYPTYNAQVMTKVIKPAKSKAVKKPKTINEMPIQRKDIQPLAVLRLHFA